MQNANFATRGKWNRDDRYYQESLLSRSQNATWEESFRENTSVIYAETRQSFYRLRR